MSQDLRTQELLQSIVSGKKIELSEADLSLILSPRNLFLETMRPILIEDITQFLKLEESTEHESPDRLLWCLHLSAFLEDSYIFPWVCKICFSPFLTIEEILGTSFILTDLSRILAATVDYTTDYLKELKKNSENPHLPNEIRVAFLKALAIQLLRGKIEREQCLSYFKTLMQRILQNESEPRNIIFVTHLVYCATLVWPHECMEEIRELYGLNLVDIFALSLDSVLQELAQGKTRCIEANLRKVEPHTLLIKNPLPPSSPTTSSPSEKKPLEPCRNDPCPCQSGRKYKKCCMQKEDPNKPPLYIDPSMISNYPLLHSSISTLPESEQEEIEEVDHLIYKDPFEAIDRLSALLDKHPDIPMLYNLLYGCYRRLGRSHQASKLLRTIREKFPDYLFGLIEHAHYLLRRGEPEKVRELFSGAAMLPQLYPHRKTFHTKEWKVFLHLQACYSIAMHKKDYAEIYLHLLKQYCPHRDLIEDIEERLKASL